MYKMAIHAQNFKCGAVGAMERHNLRKNKNYSNQEIDPERTKDNVVLKEPEVSQYQDSKAIIEDRAVNQVRSTSIWQTEFVVSSSQDFFKGLPRDEQNRFFEEAYKYLAREFGKENVTCAAVHYDETTPHMHFDFVPMTKENKLSRKEVMTRERILKIQDKLPEYLHEKGFDVERGRKTLKLDEKSKIRHRSTQEYKKSVYEAHRALQRHEKMLDRKKEKLNAEERMVQEKMNDLKTRQKKLLNETSKFNDQLRDVNDLPQGDRTITGRIALKEEEYKKLRDVAKRGIALETKYREAMATNEKLLAQREKLKAQVPTMKSRMESAEMKANIQNLEKTVEKLRTQNETMKESFRKLAKMELPDPAKKIVNNLVRSFKRVLQQDRER